MNLRARDEDTLVMRRLCLALLLSGACVWPGHALGDAPDHIVQLARLNMGPTTPGLSAALAAWAQETRLRTSVEISASPEAIRPNNKALLSHPLLYLGGDRALPKLSAPATALLRQHLLTGGMIVVDDIGRAGPSPAFDRDVRLLFQQLTNRQFERISATHVLFRSFYRLSRPVGRRADAGHVEGIKVGKHYAVIYIRDDLSGAFLRAPTGGPALRAVPGGEPQREQAHRLAINLVMYALCLDYKDDHTHVSHLLRHRRGRQAKPRPDGP